METQETQTKRCPKCGEVKPVTEFGTNRSRKDGLQWVCKSCASKIWKENYDRRRQEKLATTEIKDGLKKHANPLVSISTEDLVNELKGRGVCVLVNPTPRQLMLKLKEAGYTGTLEVMVKQTISLGAIGN